MMNIVTYEDIHDGDMSELTLACFDHTYSRAHVKGMMEADSRLPHWGGELYAVEDGRLMGTVGVLYPRLKTPHGVVRVGGIRNVCTRPSASRKGVARKLMEEAHHRMMEEGVPFSLLMTSGSLVAYELYRKLGYREIHSFPTALKKVSPVNTRLEFMGKPDPEYLRSLYMESVKELHGLVIREEDYWGMAEARGWPDNGNVITVYDGREPIGYVMYRNRRKQLDCGEIAGESVEALRDIICALEASARCEHIVFYYINPQHYPLLEEMGYTICSDNWGKVMLKEFGDERWPDDLIFHAGIYEAY